MAVHNSLEHLDMCLKSVSNLLKDQFGPNGKSVLLERGGDVLTTKDGSELLSMVSIEDPVAKTLVRDILCFCDEYGDGAKRFALVATKMFESLKTATEFANSNEIIRRVKIAEHLDTIKEKALPYIIEKLRPHFSIADARYDFNGKLATLPYAILNTKFPQRIAKTLSTILAQFLQVLINPINFIMARNYSDYIFEIPEMPVWQSRVVDGILITRNFKYLHSSTAVQNCSFTLWTEELDDLQLNSGADVITMKAASDLEEMRSSKYTSFRKVLQNLVEEESSRVIISSMYFPEWVTALCRQRGVSIIDAVPEKEFARIREGIESEGAASWRGEGSFETLAFGSHRYVKLTFHDAAVSGVSRHHTLLLCGTTRSQVRQYSNACCKILTYMKQCLCNKTKWTWNVSSEYPNNDTIYLVPSDGCQFAHIYSCAATVYDTGGFLGKEMKILRDAVMYPLQMLQNGPKSEGANYESALFNFHLLTWVCQSLLQLVRIQDVIKTHKRIQILTTASDEDEDETISSIPK